MIITHLAVSGVGRFRTRHVVKGLGPGLNLLCAPNEHGKSTLFRALHACLFFRHSSDTAEIRRLACLGAQLPAEIEVGFERAGAHYTIQKSFLSSKSSKLFKDGQLIADGPRANEQVWSILGVHESGRSVDESTFGLLWVRQGFSFDPVQPNDSARSALNRMIEAEVGQVLGGARGERVRQRIAAQIAEEETAGTGRPKAGSAWKRAIDAAEKARSELATAHATLSLLDVDFRTLEGRLARKRELDDADAMARMRADLQAAVEEQTVTQRAESLADAAEREAASFAPARELAERRQRELVALDGRITGARSAIATLEAQAAEFERVRAQHETARAGGEVRLAEAARQLAEAERSLDRLNRLSVASAGAQRAADLRMRLDRARAIREQIAIATATLSAQALSSKQFRRINEAAADLEAKRQRMLARAPQVAVQLGAEAGRRVRLQGEILESSQSAAAVGPTLIEVQGIATIQITPVAVAENAKEVEDAQATLASELGKVGARSVTEAAERRAQNEATESERRALVAELAAFAPEEGGEDGIMVLERQLAAAQASLGGWSDTDLADALQRPDQLATLRTDAERCRASWRRQREDAEAILLTTRSEVAAADVKLSACRAELRAQKARLAEDLAVSPDDSRAGQIASFAQAALDTARVEAEAKEKAAALRAAVPSAEQKATFDARIKRLTDAIAGREAELRQVQIDIATLRARVATRGGEGLGERAAELEDELAIAERDRQRIESRLNALRLLRDTIDDCRTAARDAYLAPIKRGMQPFLHALFPGAEAQFDESFSVESLRRHESEAEPFDYLSHGTREQIAVMVRLALGGLLAARGQPAPVLLDDALVFSDDDRIESMFDVLTQAAEKHQVIVLTCRSQAFRTFGGRRLTIEPQEAP